MSRRRRQLVGRGRGGGPAGRRAGEADRRQVELLGAGAGRHHRRRKGRPRHCPGARQAARRLECGLRTDLDANGLRLQWRNHLGGTPPAHLPRWLLLRVLAYQIQAAALGGLDKATLRVIRQPKGQTPGSPESGLFEARIPTTREGADLRAGAMFVREWKGKLERVTVLEKGFAWNGKSYGPIADRQSDDWHELERSPLLRLANGEVRSRCAGGPRQAGR